MKPIPEACPFCQNPRSHGRRECPCTYAYAVYQENAAEFYDLYIDIGTHTYIFGSGNEDNSGWSKLTLKGGKHVAELNSYTEPTVENIIQTAQRLLKLKAFT